MWSLGIFMVDAKLGLRGKLPSLRPRGSDGFLGRCLGELSGVWSISLNAAVREDYQFLFHSKDKYNSTFLLCEKKKKSILKTNGIIT